MILISSIFIINCNNTPENDDDDEDISGSPISLPQVKKQKQLDSSQEDNQPNITNGNDESIPDVDPNLGKKNDSNNNENEIKIEPEHYKIPNMDENDISKVLDSKKQEIQKLYPKLDIMLKQDALNFLPYIMQDPEFGALMQSAALENDPSKLLTIDDDKKTQFLVDVINILNQNGINLSAILQNPESFAENNKDAIKKVIIELMKLESGPKVLNIISKLNNKKAYLDLFTSEESISGLFKILGETTNELKEPFINLLKEDSSNKASYKQDIENAITKQHDEDFKNKTYFEKKELIQNFLLQNYGIDKGIYNTPILEALNNTMCGLVAALSRYAKVTEKTLSKEEVSNICYDYATKYLVIPDLKNNIAKLCFSKNSYDNLSGNEKALSDNYIEPIFKSKQFAYLLPTLDYINFFNTRLEGAEFKYNIFENKQEFENYINNLKVGDEFIALTALEKDQGGLMDWNTVIKESANSYKVRYGDLIGEQSIKPDKLESRMLLNKPAISTAVDNSINKTVGDILDIPNENEQNGIKDLLPKALFGIEKETFYNSFTDISLQTIYHNINNGKPFNYVAVTFDKKS